MSGCCSTAIDYTDPRTLIEGGIVQFDPALGLLSTPLFIPLLSDNITEGTEYFGLSFVPLTGDDSPVVVKPGDLHQALVAIQDTCEWVVTCMYVSILINHLQVSDTKFANVNRCCSNSTMVQL